MSFKEDENSCPPNNEKSKDLKLNLRRCYSSPNQARRKSSKRKLFHRVSASFIPSCVLSPNKNPLEELYRLFPQLPPGESPLNGFTCALHKDILLQGKMIVCTNCVCFHSNIFGYETRVIIYFKNVLAIRREKTAFVVPNAISIRTLHKRYFFCSFLSRESVYKLLSTIWKTSTLNTDDLIIEDDVGEGKIRHHAEPPTKKIGRNFFCHDISSLDCSADSNFYLREFEYPERPHTSPPILNNILPDEENLIHPHQPTIEPTTDSGSEIEDELEDTIEKCTRSFSLADVRELEKIQLQLGEEKLKKIDRDMQMAFGERTTIHGHKKIDGRHRKILDLFQSYEFRYNIFRILSILAYQGRRAHEVTPGFPDDVRIIHGIDHLQPVLNSVLTLVCHGGYLRSHRVIDMLRIVIMAGITISLLIQINFLTKKLQLMSEQTPMSQMEELLHYEEILRQTKQDRLKTILLSNINTIKQIQSIFNNLSLLTTKNYI